MIRSISWRSANSVGVKTTSEAGVMGIGRAPEIRGERMALSPFGYAAALEALGALAGLVGFPFTVVASAISW